MRPDRNVGRKKNDQAVQGLTFDSAEQHVPCGQQYSVHWCNGSCRWSPFAVRPCVRRQRDNALRPVGAVRRNRPRLVDRPTVALAIGLAALLRPKVVAEDWVWMIDHSIQIGQCKCLVILGIRLSEFPWASRCAIRTWS